MKKTKLHVLFLFICLTSMSYAQKVILKEGDCSFLKGEKSVNVIYDYSNMAVGKFDKEEDYVKTKVDEHNAKEAGKGDKWKESWEGARQRVYAPKFEELFNKTMMKLGLTIEQGREDAKYTLIVKTTFTEPGFNIGIVKQSAAVSFEYIFVETGTDNVMAKFTQVKVPGAQAMGYDYDAGTRISESYAKGGKMLAAFIYGKLK